MRAAGGDAVDRAWMRQALALARLGEGTTAPNPRVGALVVREGVPVGWGWHRAAGAEHAEVAALTRAGEAARGATLYVSLEPCAHRGRTPPCVGEILAAGIRRVVAAVQDPDPRVNGRGFAALREAGVELCVGTLQEAARWLNRDFFHWQATRRPWVTLKAAVSLDGMLAARQGASRWITGEPARRWAHRLRLRHDAVLVGAGTIRRDDPQLTVRLPGAARTPLRVVLSRSLELDPRARVFREQGPVRVYTGLDAPQSRRRALEAAGAEVRAVASDGSGLDLGALLEDLGAAGVQSLLVEGGGKTCAAFALGGFVREVVLFGAPCLVGAEGGTPLVAGPAVDDPARGLRFRGRGVFALGRDVVWWGSCVPE